MQLCLATASRRLALQAIAARLASLPYSRIGGKAYISPEKLQQVAEALKAASSQPKNPAA